jgi:hypothetical protein
MVQNDPEGFPDMFIVKSFNNLLLRNRRARASIFDMLHWLATDYQCVYSIALEKKLGQTRGL